MRALQKSGVPFIKRKRAAGAWRSRVVFVAAWFAGWILLTRFFIAGVASFELPEPIPHLVDYLFWLGTQLGFGLIQVWLMRRLTRIQPHRWLSWTFLGLLVGIICESLWKDFVYANGWLENETTRFIYEKARYCLLFGIPAIFQYFSLPMHLARRWYWLLAALAGLTQNFGDGVRLSIALQALAIDRIDARNFRLPMAEELETEDAPDDLKHKA